MAYEQLLKNVQLMKSLESGNFIQINELLNDGADINFVNLHGKHETPLHLAVLSGDPNLVKLLLDRGANPELQNVNLKKPKDLCSSLDDQKKNAVEAVFGRYFKRDRSVGPDQKEQPGTESTVKTFVKRPGTAAVGQFYETKMLTMVLFRLLHDDRVGGFYLGNNLDEAGAFDDIVLRVHDAGGGGRSRVYCLQAKHKKPEHVVNFDDLITLKDKKDPFNLEKYFESCLQIRYTFDPAGDHAIFRGEFEQTELEMIIFTPAVINSFDDALVEVTKRDNLFYTDKKGKIIQIRCTKVLEDTFVKKSEEWHRKTIAETLVKLISIEKYDTTSLKEAIEKLEKENVLGKLTNKSVEFNYSSILQLFGNPQFMSYSSRIPKKLCEEIEKILNEPLLPGAEDHAKLAQKFFAQLKFYSEQATEDKLEEIVRRDMKARSVASDEIFFPKLHEAVERWWKRTGDVPFLTQNCELYEIAANQVELEKMHENSLSRVRIDEVRFDAKVTAKAKWVDLFESQTFVNIFSSTPELSCIRVIQYLQSQSADFKFVIVDITKLNYKLENCLSAQPDCSIIAYLPEVDIKILEIIRKATKKFIVVTKLKQEGDWISISDESRGLPDLEISSQKKILASFVIFQGFSVSLGSLLDKAPPKFIDAETLQKLIFSKTLIVSNNNFAMDFEKLKGWYVNRDVVNIRSKKLLLIEKIADQVAFIAAEPGMGKSTLLTGHAVELKESDPLKWVIRMNLLDLSRQFSKWSDAKTNLTEDDARNLLLEITSYDSGQIGSFEREIFGWYCTQRRIVLLIDAVDEISPNYTDTVLQLIKLYKRNFTAKLRVTTRPGRVVQDLENERNFVQFSLEPFTKEQSKLFLGKFWETNLKIRLNPLKFEQYYAQLLTHLLEKRDVGKDDLVSIPLQLRMIAMLFQDHFHAFCTSSNDGQARFEKLDLVSLYERFINLQFKEILLEEKNKTDTSKPYHANEMEKNLRKLFHTHKLAAIDTLFYRIDMFGVFSDDEMMLYDIFRQTVEKSHERAGIITKFVFKTPMFVHRSYAEFFAAQLIWEKFSVSSVEAMDLFHKFTRSIIFNDLNQVAKFLHQIAQQKIHKCFEVVDKMCKLLEELKSILDKSLKIISSKALASLLGFVEESLANDTNCFLAVKQFVYEQTEDFQDMLLIISSESDYLELVRLLIDRNPDKINASFDALQDKTASQLDASQSIMEKIKNATANEQLLSSFRFSVLQRAAMKGSAKVVFFLLEREAPIDAATKQGETALYLACAAGHLQVVQMLITHGANVNITTAAKLTPLHIAVRNGHLDVIRTLLDVNTNDVDTPTDLNEVPLLAAVVQGFTEIAVLLLEKGADVNIATNIEGWTSLHYAVYQNLHHFVVMLLERGANIASVTLDREETALHMAVNATNLKMVQLLISKSADVNALDKCGKTALNYAIKNKSIEIVNTLLDNGALLYEWDRGWTPLHEAAAVGSSELVKLFLQKGIDINSRARHGVTPLMLACFSRQNNLVKLMLEKGADVHLGTYEDAFMPMHLAAEKNCHEMIKLMVKKGASIDCVTKVGYSPLQAAINRESRKAVMYLLELGADLDLGSMYNCTPVQMAKYNLGWDITQFPPVVVDSNWVG